MTRSTRGRILVAEDDFLVSRDIARCVGEAGYEVVGVAADGARAVALTRELHPDAVLMDIQMPILDGIAASDAIQRECPTPVVILTAYDNQDFVDKAGRAGVGAFLVKPPDAARIDRAITIAVARHRDLMEIRRAHDELEQALAEIRTLRGILPLCSFCKKVRNDQGYWEQVDVYITEHTHALVSHSLCPDCLREHYPRQYEAIANKNSRAPKQSED